MMATVASTPAGHRKAWNRWITFLMIVAIVIACSVVYRLRPPFAASAAEPSDVAAIRAVLQLADERPSEVARWWTGAWAPPVHRYHRPVTATMMWAQWKVWGDDWDRWSQAAIALQLGISLLVFAFVGLVARSRLAGFIAAMLFTMPLPFSPERDVVALCLSRFPVQGDLWCALFYLSSCFHLVRWLRENRTRNLAWSLVFFVLAVLSKEVAFSLVIVAVLTVLHEGYCRPALIARKVWPFFAVAAALMGGHVLAVGGIGGPNRLFLSAALQRFGSFAAYPLLQPLGMGDYWPAIAGAAVAIFIAAVIACPRLRCPWVVIGGALGLWALLALAAQALLGAWAVAVAPDFAGPMMAVRVAVMLLGGWLLIQTRRASMLYFLAFGVVAYLPTFLVIGFSYIYLPTVGWVALTGMLAAEVYGAYTHRWPRGRWAFAAAGLLVLAADLLSPFARWVTEPILTITMTYAAALVVVVGALYLVERTKCGASPVA